MDFRDGLSKKIAVLLDFVQIRGGEGPAQIFVGPLQRVRPRNGILGLVLVVVVVLPLRSEFIGEL